MDKPSAFDNIYGDIYDLGDGYKRAVLKLLRGIGFIFEKIGRLFVIIFTFFKNTFLKFFNAIKNEKNRLASEIRRAAPSIKKAYKESFKKGTSELFKYTKRFFKLHRPFNRAVLSSVIPAVSLAVLIVFISAFGSLSFGLNVSINGKDVGTASSEAVFKEAENEALKRLKASGAEKTIPSPVYKINISGGKTDDSETICENIISALDDKTIPAAGIYIDGKFLCAVKSEDTFNRIKDEILNEYKERYGYTKVDFCENITVKPGIYSENENIWSYEKLKSYMKGYKTDPIEHTVKKDEKTDDILAKYGITLNELKSLNKELNEDYLPEGSTLLIKKGVPNLNIRANVSRVEVKTTKYGTVSQYDNNLYVGTKMVVVEGVEGRDVVSYSDTYIDGKKIGNSKEISRYNVNSPVNELVKIGTKGVPVDTQNNNLPISPRLYRDQGGTFIWPAPDNCFWLSQGYNPANSHYGIDIVSSNGSSCKGRRIVAVADGIVVMATYHYSWGYYIRVDHGDGVVTGYAHALKDSFRVNVGDYVKAGQQLSSIGTTGNSTGYHLHFEVWLDGVRVNPLPYVYSQYTGVAV